jgi:hypothetical protein
LRLCNAGRQLIARIMHMNAPKTYRCRLRFRVEKKLNVKAPKHTLNIAGREVVLSPQIPDKDIADNEWLIFNAREFATEAEAKDFCHRLRSALEVSSVATRLGVDAGRDIATSGLGAHFRQEVKARTGLLVRDNIHGVDVFVDEPNVRIVNLTGTGTIRKNPEPFLSDLDSLHAIASSASARTKDVILLLNVALMQPNPVAQIVFSISAVEMLGQETWSDNQKQLLTTLADHAKASSIGTKSERDEVAEAILRTHRLSLRQGVLRLLDSLGLAALKRTWDNIYAERSTLVHGLAPKPGIDYSDQATRTVDLCGRILLKVIAFDIPGADRHVDTFYTHR